MKQIENKQKEIITEVEQLKLYKESVISAEKKQGEVVFMLFKRLFSAYIIS